MDQLPNWPPRDWRAALALVLSAGGAVALTFLLWLLAAMLLPEKGWSVQSEGERVSTIRWTLWICAFCILLVLTGLGFSASRRGLRLKRGDSRLEWEGGEDFGKLGEEDAEGTGEACVAAGNRADREGRDATGGARGG